MSQFKLAIKDALENSLFKLKGKDNGIHVLTYHGLIDKIEYPRLQRNFHTVDKFYSQMKAIKSGRGIVLRPEEFEAQWNDKKLFRNKKAFLLTFDDGYRNNLKAMEILDDIGFEAAYFITTSTIGSTTSIWTVNLSLLLLDGDLEQIEFENQKLSLSNTEERKKTFNTIRYRLKVAVGASRELEMNKIIEQFPAGELERLMDKHSYFKMLTAKELSNVAARGQCIQSHGVTHELFHEKQTEKVVLNEMKKSKLALEEITKKPVTWYAYPNGDDAQREVASSLNKCGYKMGFSMGYSPFLPEQSGAKIPRYNATQHDIKFLF